MSTRTAVREPVLRFALRASWPGGEVVKTYELIIDPPYVAYPRTSASTTITVRAPTSATRAITAPVSARAGTSFGPVAGGATLYPIARSAYPQMSARLPQVMAVIVESNPDAFVGGSADQLLRGAVLALPAASDMPLPKVTRFTPLHGASWASPKGSCPQPWRAFMHSIRRPSPTVTSIACKSAQCCSLRLKHRHKGLHKRQLLPV
jgi:FimV-like protein